MKRISKDIKLGLTDEEAKIQMENGNVNKDMTIPTKSISAIIFSNVFTLFNMLNLALGIIVFFTKSYKNLLFLGTVITNTIISIIQELRAKREVDTLSLMSEPKAIVIRNGEEKQTGINDIVLNDIIKYKTGNQIVVDSIIIEGTVEVNESFISGESDTILKKEGEMLLSGSFIVSGICYAKVEHIKENNYSSKISKEAKYIKKINSVLLSSLNTIIKIISWIIIPLGILLFINQYYILNSPLSTAIINTIAALISMIPEGLILLTSTVLMVSVIKLSKKKVLVKQLFCIETLARVNTICFDKTGTLTKGKMNVKKVIRVNDKYDMKEIMNNICSNIDDDNATINALKEHFRLKKYKKADEIIPFSSQRKYSGIIISNKTYLIGAPEFVTNEKINLDEYNNYRTILLVEKCAHEDIIIGIILLEDILREEAVQTIEYFINEGVDVKIISGDNPRTVKNIAKRLNLNLKNYVDVSKLTEKELKEIVLKTTIFGRVSPFQKKIIVEELKKNGKTVAMVGDGVNDVLALKESDCSIALACGSSAVYNVSDLVLLDSDFTSIPSIVEEGRKTINNIEKSASLYIVKTCYAVILTIVFMIIPYKYPFIPIQLTLTSVLTIGIPSFILALEPNKDIISKKFLSNILKKALPTSISIVIAILLITYSNTLTFNEKSTLSVIAIGIIGLIHIYRVAKPLRKYHYIMLTSLFSLFCISILFFENIFSMTHISVKMLLLLIIILIITILIYKIVDICKLNKSKKNV